MVTEMNCFQNQTAVITGASSGIGRAIALKLAQENANLVLVARNMDRLQEVARIAQTGAPQIDCIHCDFSQENALRTLANQLKQKLAEVHLLVHCAGSYHTGPLLSEPVQNLDELYQVHVRAPYVLTQALLPALQACHGQIVFVNSSAGAARSQAKNGPYAATKHALRVLSDSLRDEVNASGVRVINLFPGRTATPMQAHIFELEGRMYRPDVLIQPEDIAALLMNILTLPRTIEVTEVHFRPMMKSY